MRSDTLPEALRLWLEAQEDLGAAWRLCPEAHWLIYMAVAVNIDRVLVVHAAADVAASALALRKPGDPRAQRALRVARAWLEGQASASDAWASGFGASEAADTATDPGVAEVVRAAALVAFACDARADATFYAHRSDAARAVELAARAIGEDTSAARPADWVRARIPLPSFLSASDLAAQRPPPPEPDVEETELTEEDSFYA